MRKKDEALDGGSEWSVPAGGRVTPQDVQQKEFRVTRVGAGYRMREVDEFLDQITDTLSALIAENERLRMTGGAAPRPSATETPAVATPTRADRRAVDAFLQREKGFLQDLGGLVQAHAEELRSMIRSTRGSVSSAGSAPEAAPEAAVEAEPVAEPPATIEPAPERGSEQMAEPAPPVDEPLSGTGEVEPRTEPAPMIDEDADDDDVDGDQVEVEETGTITRVVEGEPIRLEEPEPARSTRTDEQEGDSLRELFWGEE
jgi:DivIVA domain-containing protein